MGSVQVTEKHDERMETAQRQAMNPQGMNFFGQGRGTRTMIEDRGPYMYRFTSQKDKSGTGPHRM